MNKLYVVSMPIGNLDDVTLRALKVLGGVGLIAAEDTRKIKVLMKHFQITTPVISYHDHNEKAKIPHLLARLQDEDIALVSDAGTPGINDPGYELVRACIERGIPVTPVPGPSAITAALVISGMPIDRFIFLGYVSRKQGERQRLFSSLERETRTVLFLETPHRLRRTLEDLVVILPEREIALCREMTKTHEEVFRGTASEALAHFEKPRGEFVLLLAGGPIEAMATDMSQEILATIMESKAAGQNPKDVARHLSEVYRVSRRHVYRIWHQTTG